MTKIFVGNFNFAIDENKLREFFSKIGEVVSVKIMTESNGGKSRGFGFIEYATEEEAKRAIAELDGANFDGRVIKVSEDKGNVAQANNAVSIKKSQYTRSSQPNNSTRVNNNLNRSNSFSQQYARQQAQAAMGYFRAQPLDLGIKKKRRQDPFVEDPSLKIDYKNPKVLRRFMSERGKVLSRRVTGLTATNQRLLTIAIRRAQQLALLPIVNK